jgi:hypothetical protein
MKEAGTANHCAVSISKFYRCFTTIYQELTSLLRIVEWEMVAYSDFEWRIGQMWEETVMTDICREEMRTIVKTAPVRGSNQVDQPAECESTVGGWRAVFVL